LLLLYRYGERFFFPTGRFCYFTVALLLLSSIRWRTLFHPYSNIPILLAAFSYEASAVEATCFPRGGYFLCISQVSGG
jgi:hypothetical protein